jgi:hypothetical protein
LATGALLASALYLLSGCNQPGAGANDAKSPGSGSTRTSARSIPPGTRLEITLGSALSSETAHVGDPWRGTVAGDMATSSGMVIPGGTRVRGEVGAVVEARRGSRAMLQLNLTRIELGGAEQPIAASAEEVVAGSTRKRNLGAIAGGAAAGALLGKVVGDGHNAAAGGLVGGAAATGVVASSKGFQVELASGTVMKFVVREALAMKS